MEKNKEFLDELLAGLYRDWLATPSTMDFDRWLRKTALEEIGKRIYGLLKDRYGDLNRFGLDKDVDVC